MMLDCYHTQVAVCLTLLLDVASQAESLSSATISTAENGQLRWQRKCGSDGIRAHGASCVTGRCSNQLNYAPRLTQITFSYLYVDMCWRIWSH